MQKRIGGKADWSLAQVGHAPNPKKPPPPTARLIGDGKARDFYHAREAFLALHNDAGFDLAGQEVIDDQIRGVVARGQSRNIKGDIVDGRAGNDVVVLQTGGLAAVEDLNGEGILVLQDARPQERSAQLARPHINRDILQVIAAVIQNLQRLLGDE